MRHNGLTGTTAPARQRTVFTERTLPSRGCLYCLGTEGDFASQEHVIPRIFGAETDDYVLPQGVVCDACNSWLGRQVDAPFVDRFDVKLTRALEERRGRSGAAPLEIAGRDVTSRLDLELGGVTVVLYATRTSPTDDGGLNFVLRPRHRDPADIVSRTVRALWKIALGCAWLVAGSDALAPRFDHLRRAILGAPFKGYLLQAPWIVTVNRRLDIELDISKPESPTAITFSVGGVVLAAPLATGASLTRADVGAAGWLTQLTTEPAVNEFHFRLEPN